MGATPDAEQISVTPLTMEHDLPARVWPHIRAALIALVVVICGVAAAPMPGPGARSALADASGQRELQTWVDLLEQVGITATKEQLTDVVMAFSKGTRSTRSTILYPFKHLFRITATQQGWALFAYPDTHPNALVIDGKNEGSDHYFVLYDSTQPELDWQASTLQYRRVRALYNPSSRAAPGYGGLASAMARRAFADHPELTTVRFRLRRYKTNLPWDGGAREEMGYRYRKTRHRPKE